MPRQRCNLRHWMGPTVVKVTAQTPQRRPMSLLKNRMNHFPWGTPLLDLLNNPRTNPPKIPGMASPITIGIGRWIHRSGSDIGCASREDNDDHLGLEEEREDNECDEESDENCVDEDEDNEDGSDEDEDDEDGSDQDEDDEDGIDQDEDDEDGSDEDEDEQSGE